MNYLNPRGKAYVGRASLHYKGKRPKIQHSIRHKSLAVARASAHPIFPRYHYSSVISRNDSQPRSNRTIVFRNAHSDRRNPNEKTKENKNKDMKAVLEAAFESRESRPSSPTSK
jgi:hypothetical protein